MSKHFYRLCGLLVTLMLGSSSVQGWRDCSNALELFSYEKSQIYLSQLEKSLEQRIHRAEASIPWAEYEYFSIFRQLMEQTYGALPLELQAVSQKIDQTMMNGLQRLKLYRGLLEDTRNLQGKRLPPERHSREVRALIQQMIGFENDVELGHFWEAHHKLYQDFQDALKAHYGERYFEMVYANVRGQHHRRLLQEIGELRGLLSEEEPLQVERIWKLIRSSALNNQHLAMRLERYAQSSQARRALEEFFE